METPIEILRATPMGAGHPPSYGHTIRGSAGEPCRARVNAAP
jgi:hypothetical protein